MGELGVAAIGAVVYGIIREIGGQIVSIKKTNNEIETAENEAYKTRTNKEITELRVEYELQKQRTDAAVKELTETRKVAAKEVEDVKKIIHDCEKDKIRLEGKIDLLTKLFARDLPADSKLHKILKQEGE